MDRGARSASRVARVMLAVMALAGVALVSCGDDDDDSGAGDAATLCAALEDGETINDIALGWPTEYPQGAFETLVANWTLQECPQEAVSNEDLRGFLTANGFDPDDLPALGNSVDTPPHPDLADQLRLEPDGRCATLFHVDELGDELLATTCVEGEERPTAELGSVDTQQPDAFLLVLLPEGAVDPTVTGPGRLIATADRWIVVELTDSPAHIDSLPAVGYTSADGKAVVCHAPGFVTTCD